MRTLALVFFLASLIFSTLSGIAASEKKKEPSTLEKITMVLKFGTPDQIISVLPKIPKLEVKEQKTLIPELKQCLNSDFVSVQTKTIGLLQSLKWSDLNTDVTKLIPTENIDLYLAALRYIQKKKIKSVAPVIVKALQKEDFTKDSRLIPELILTLEKIEDHSAESFLNEKLKDKNTKLEYKKNIVLYFGNVRVKDSAAQKTLLDLFNDQEANLGLRSYAANALGKAKISAATAELKKELESIEKITDLDEKRKYARMKVYILSSLIQLNDKGVKELLLKMARSAEAGVRKRAIRQLGEIKAQDAVEMLEFKRKYDPDPSVRKEARKALEKITGKKIEEKKK